jgi:GNAT superfamily N-acetyltransferase
MARGNSIKQGRVARSEVKTYPADYPRMPGLKYLDKIAPVKEKSTLAAIEALRKVSTLNTNIPEEDYGEHRDYTTADGSRATYAVSMSAWDNTLVLRTIESISGKGAGTELMNKMTEIADKKGVPVILRVEPFQPTRSGKSKRTIEQMHSFYSKFGFVLDERPERNRGGESGMLMIRPPSKTKP